MSTYQLMNKEKFLVLFLSTYSIISIVFYELTDMHRLMTGMCSEKCAIRQFLRFLKVYLQKT